MSAMLHNDLIGFGLFIGHFIIMGLLVLLIKVLFKAPFEITRKMLHLIVTLSIFPLLELFSTWYTAVLAAFGLVLIAYPVLALLEKYALYNRLAVERKRGEFKSSLIVVQATLAALIFIFWGVMGEEWRYIAVVAVMAWGFGDAAAALVGKAFGYRQILHPKIEGKKTLEGTLAMFCVSGLAVLLTMLLYAGQIWHVSLTVSVIVAFVCAIVELFSRRGMDTLTVPISAAVTTLSLLTLFPYLGL